MKTTPRPKPKPHAPRPPRRPSPPPAPRPRSLGPALPPAETYGGALFDAWELGT